MAVSGIKVVTPSTPVNVVGLMAAAVRSDDPVLFFEHKGLYASKGEIPDGEIVDVLGTASVRRPGTDATILALGLMVPRALEAAGQLSERGISAEVIEVPAPASGIVVQILVPEDATVEVGTVLAVIGERAEPSAGAVSADGLPPARVPGTGIAAQSESTAKATPVIARSPRHRHSPRV